MVANSQRNLILIRKVVRQIAGGFRPEKIVLFGSHAYGRPDRDSDVDLLVVMESNKRPVDRTIEVSKSLSFHPFPMDIFVRTPGEVHNRLRRGDCFFEEILGKGNVLYER